VHGVPSTGFVAGHPVVAGGQTPTTTDHAPPEHVPRSTPPHALFHAQPRPSSEHDDPPLGSPSGHALHVGTNQLPPTHRAVIAHGDAYGHPSAPVQSVPSIGGEGGHPGPESIGGGGVVSIGGGVESIAGVESSIVVSIAIAESFVDESSGGCASSATAEIFPPHATSAIVHAIATKTPRPRMNSRLAAGLGPRTFLRSITFTRARASFKMVS
jgi:hypothetical protein